VAGPLGAPNSRGEDRAHPQGRPTPAGPDEPAQNMGKPCLCGHGKLAHEHYRKGADCALCDCRRYRRSLLARLGLRPS
jgi:hypothetical protein